MPNNTGSDEIIVTGGSSKTLITEAKKQQEGVDVLLDRGQRFLAVRANIVLEVDLENLVFLWNSYVENLRKLQAPLATHQTLKKVKDCASEENLENSCQVVSVPDYEVDFSCRPANLTEKQTLKEDISVELKDKDSNSSSGSSGCIESVQDTSFQDAGKLTLDDLRTATTPLHISELVQERPGDLAVATPGACELVEEADSCCEQQHQQWNDVDVQDDGFNPDQDIKSDLLAAEVCDSALAVPGQFDTGNEMEVECYETCSDMIYPDDAVLMPSDEGDMDVKGIQMSSSGDCPPSPATPVVDEKEAFCCDHLRAADQDMEALATFESPTVKAADKVPGSEPLPGSDVRRRKGLLEAPVVNVSNQSSRSESPLSLDSSRSETPTGTLKRAERQNELWRAIGSIDTFLLDKDILEACKSTAGDLTSEDEDCAGTPNVSFAEFLQQYRELTDWLNQVHKVTQREVTSLSEKYLNQSYQEEMLERSPRREFLNNYSRQLLRRYPGLGEEVGARMARLNAQWAALEKTVAPAHGLHDTDNMLRDLESDLSTLRRWLNAIEARLLPLTIKADWTDAELEQRLQRHKMRGLQLFVDLVWLPPVISFLICHKS
ncbi:tubulin alpha-1 chain [Plakobranchus ocellatus]|uniref:Tubulin alpha-1 chain n=1 Tax=Plakobranchus ocellatus TaxID=259542 RepID=A0AAV4AB28_9GAST|nr:tubulin alpha-1 chain [Plakobranchus ocellatus]